MFDLTLITTIITAYKRPTLLKRAIESVLAQSYPKFQVIIFDNASNDETGEIVRAFMQKDSRVKYHCHPENIGMMANYAFAFSKINTPYFSLLSDDDFLLPWFYETAIAEFVKHPDAGFVGCGTQLVTSSGELLHSPLNLWEREGYYPREIGLLEMLRKLNQFPVPTGVLFQSHIIKDIKPDLSEKIQILWDPCYLMEIAIKHPIVINKKISAIYVAHNNSFCQNFFSQNQHLSLQIQKYVIACNAIIKKTKNNEFLSIKNKSLAIKLFNKNAKENIYKTLLLNTCVIKKHKHLFESIIASQKYLSPINTIYIFFNYLLAISKRFIKTMFYPVQNRVTPSQQINSMDPNSPAVLYKMLCQKFK